MVAIGITSQPQHPNAARLYVDFALSNEGQKILADMGRYLARSEFMKDQAAKAKGLQMVPENRSPGNILKNTPKPCEISLAIETIYHVSARQSRDQIEEEI